MVYAGPRRKRGSLAGSRWLDLMGWYCYFKANKCCARLVAFLIGWMERKDEDREVR